jgi:hypothetical protein
MRTPREFPIFTIFVLMVITLYAREDIRRQGWSVERSFLPG